MGSPIRLAVAAVVLLSIPGAEAASPAGVPDSWRTAVGRRIELERYEIREDGSGSLSAANPAHGLALRFDGRGVAIAPASATEAAWSLRLSLRGWGRPGRLEAPGGSNRRADGSRVELARAGLTEWFFNAPEGLEQGFTIPSPPRAGAGLLVLDLELGGSLQPRFSDDGSAVDFSRGAGLKVLRYAALRTIDATGVELPSRFVAIPGGVRIAIDDGRAVYPISVDPMVTTPAWTVDGDQAGAAFGVSLASAGDVNADGYSDIIVGAPGHDGGGGAGSERGRAYLYLGGPGGPAPAATWFVSGDEDLARLGSSVASAGDVNGDGYSDVVVAAVLHDGGAAPGADRGRAYVYLGSPGGLSPLPAWTGSGDVDAARFGTSVATAGDVNGDGFSDVVVGAKEHDGGGAPGARRGRAYLYLGSVAGLTTSPLLIASGNEDDALLGCSVATAGDVDGDGFSDVVIGANGHDGGGSPGANRGTAYLFLGGAGGLTASAWAPSGDMNGSEFGFSVSSAGDVDGDGYADILVGAPFWGGSQGAVYLYLGSSSGPALVASWSTAGSSNSLLGAAVAGAGDVNGDGFADVVMGGPGTVLLASSLARLYLGGTGGPAPIAAWSASGDGSHVAIGGDVNGDGLSDLLVGDTDVPIIGTTPGHARLYLGGTGVLATTSTLLAEGDEDQAYFGNRLASVGDVNGDGYDDAVIGAYAHDAGGTNRGRAYLHLGSAAGLVPSAWIVSGDEDGAGFGGSVAGAGDVDGDGYADVVVGAPQHDAGAGAGADRGRAYLYLGSAAGLATTPAWCASGDENDGWFGGWVAGAGDVNGDGYSDVLVAATSHDAGAGGGANRGRAYLYLGSAAGLATNPAWSASGDENGAQFGTSIDAAGDVDGDGYGDVSVGAPQHDASCGAGTNCGRVYVYHGGPAGLAASPLETIDGDTPGAALGISLAGAGDVNRDGFSDLVIGAYLHPGGGSFRGRAYLYLGTPAGLVASPWVVSGDEDLAAFGSRVATAGDVDGDGYSDVLVTAALHDAPAGANAGRAYVYLGSAAGLGTTAAWTDDGDEANALFGSFGDGGGDVDGDGLADLLVSADRHDAGGGAFADRGRVYLYAGGDGPGVSVAPRQLRADLSAPIAPGGLAHDMSLRLAMKLRNPFGRGLVKLQWQVVPLGESWNPVWHPIQDGTLWWDSRIVPLVRSELVALPQVPGPFVWRMRVRYGIPTSPFQQHGPWLALAANGLGETDLRGTLAPPPPPCDPPDERIWIYQVTASVPEGFPILHCQDPNQPSQTTGYNVYRSSDAAPPPSTWPMMASNVVDMDEATPNIQYTDSTGDVSPTGSWYYHVTAYNSRCPAEGPF